jgi:hypothetical protein
MHGSDQEPIPACSGQPPYEDFEDIELCSTVEHMPKSLTDALVDLKIKPAMVVILTEELALRAFQTCEAADEDGKPQTVTLALRASTGCNCKNGTRKRVYLGGASNCVRDSC